MHKKKNFNFTLFNIQSRYTTGTRPFKCQGAEHGSLRTTTSVGTHQEAVMQNPFTYTNAVPNKV